MHGDQLLVASIGIIAKLFHPDPVIHFLQIHYVSQMHGDQLLVANAGDSRCVVSEKGKAVPMSFDHKPTDAAEHSRIIKVGSIVNSCAGSSHARFFIHCTACVGRSLLMQQSTAVSSR